MNYRILTLLAETSLHPGAGRDTGVIDLPVAREAVTDFPVIVGPSLKGALRDKAREVSPGQVDSLFGKADDGGALLIHDARLLLLPVRSLDTPFRWVTCPQILERLRRDLDRSGLLEQVPLPAAACLGRGKFLGQGDAKLILEERLFDHLGEAKGWGEALKKLLPDGPAHQATAASLESKLTILSDEDFSWFAQNSLPVNARNRLDEEKKTSTNLWYEETLPPDSFFYALIANRKTGTELQDFESLFAKPYLQVGGNATVGMGWCATHLIGKEAKK